MYDDDDDASSDDLAYWQHVGVFYSALDLASTVLNKHFYLMHQPLETT